MIFQILLMLIQSKSVVVHSWDPLEFTSILCRYLACTELTKERWNTRIKKEMNDWLAIYRRQNVSVGRLAGIRHARFLLSFLLKDQPLLTVESRNPECYICFQWSSPKTSKPPTHYMGIHGRFWPSPLVNDTSHLKGKATTPCTLQSTPWHPTSPPTAPSSRHSKSTWAPLSTSLDVLTRDLVKSKWHHGGFVFATAEGPKFPFPNKRRPRFFELCQQVATGSHWMTALLRYWLVKDSRPRC